MESHPDTSTPWLAENVRFTGIQPISWKYDPKDMFTNIFGRHATNRQDQYQGQLSILTCQDGDRAYSLSIQPGRLDLVMTQAPGGFMVSGPSPMPNIGDPVAAVAEIKTFVGNLMNLDFRCKRVAFGGVFFHEQTSQQACNAELGAVMKGIDFDPSTTTDLLYRINRPRNLVIEGHAVKVNRLTSWLSFAGKSFEMSLGGASSEKSTFGTRAEFDINTDAANPVDGVNAKASQAMFNYLADCAIESLNGGDIP